MLQHLRYIVEFDEAFGHQGARPLAPSLIGDALCRPVPIKTHLFGEEKKVAFQNVQGVCEEVAVADKQCRYIPPNCFAIIRSAKRLC